MPKHRRNYIPALRFGWLTFLYDPLLRWVMREQSFKSRLIAQARIAPGHRVLDLGCGTGTLTLMVKRARPQAEVVGLDGDSKVLAIARDKAARSGQPIAWDLGMAYELPYPDASFDRVLSSLVVHHLTTEDKERTFSEVFRVLKPGGEFHLADMGRPHNFYAFLVSQVMRRLERTDDNIQGRLPGMVREAGFEQVQETAQFTTIFGALSLWQGCKPG